MSRSFVPLAKPLGTALRGLLVALLVSSVTSAPGAAQTTWIVPDDHALIQDAVDAASAGDRILVRPGTYVENVVIDGKSIELKSMSGARVTSIQAALPGPVLSITNVPAGPYIRGFTIEQGNGVFGGGIDCSGASPHIKDCVIRDNQATVGGGIGTRFPGTATVVGCEIYDNTALIGGGISTFDTGLFASGCTIYRNVSTQGDGGGIWSDCLVTFGCPGAFVRNTILWSNVPSQIEASTTATQVLPDVRFCDVQGGYLGGFFILDADPLFANGQLGNFYLEPLSPCIDAGDNNEMLSLTDIDGNPRAFDGSRAGMAIADLGALEAMGARLGGNYCGPAVENTSGMSARLLVSGSLVAGANDLNLVATGLPANQFGYFVASPTQGFVQMPGLSSGNFCLGSPFLRLLPPVLNAGSGGVFVFEPDLTNVPPIGSIGGGETWNFQAWFRDIGSTSNFTDGAQVVFQ